MTLITGGLKDESGSGRSDVVFGLCQMAGRFGDPGKQRLYFLGLRLAYWETQNQKSNEVCHSTACCW